MVESYSWVKTVLEQVFPHSDWIAGVDIDQDGQVTPEERIRDIDGDGTVGSPPDWEKFLDQNAVSLQRRTSFFQWAAPFKTDNPLHELASIEMEIVGEEPIQKMYEFVAQVLQRVRDRLRDGTERSSQQKVALVYYVIKELGIEFEEQNQDPLLSSNLVEGTLDCDTYSFVVLAVGHELGWPVGLVHMPADHVFVRWEDQGERFNIDLADFFSIVLL